MIEADETAFFMKYYVYILESQLDNSKYIGQSQNLDDRIKLHNLGYIQSTAFKKPWKLYAYKIVNSRSESALLEKKLKNLKSPTRLQAFLIKNDFIITNH